MTVSKNSMGDEYLDLTLEIEEKKFRYKISRRPIAWFLSFFAVDTLIILSSSLFISLFGQNSYLGGWGIVFAIASGFAFIAMGIYFFYDYETRSEKFGFMAIRRFKALIALKEEIESQQIELRILDGFRAAARPAKDKYAEEISQTIQQYTKKANRNRRFYYTLQIIIIFCSLLVTGLTSGLTDIVSIFNTRWITPAISFAVSFLTAMITLFRFRERGHNQQLTADAIQYEISCAMKGIYGYKGLSEQDAYIKLAEEVERLINEQRKRQQQLEQASDTKQTHE